MNTRATPVLRGSQVNCLMIPMQHRRQLLLPNTCIAEIVDYQEPEREGDSDAWFLGFIRWRGLKLPLVSYEGANGDSVENSSSHQRIAITNSVGRHAAAMPFAAFRTEGLPRLARVNHGEVRLSDDPAVGEVDEMLVDLNGETAAIPSLERLEELAFRAKQEY